MYIVRCRLQGAADPVAIEPIRQHLSTIAHADGYVQHVYVESADPAEIWIVFFFSRAVGDMLETAVTSLLERAVGPGSPIEHWRVLEVRGT